jgi:hypothetical protein
VSDSSVNGMNGSTNDPAVAVAEARAARAAVEKAQAEFERSRQAVVERLRAWIDELEIDKSELFPNDAPRQGRKPGRKAVGDQAAK